VPQTKRILLYSVALSFLGGCASFKDPGPAGTVPLSVQANPHTDSPAFAAFDRYAEVFGLRVYADSGFTDEQVLHAVSVLAELIDNNEDGDADDPAVLQALQQAGFVMPMFTSEDAESMQAFERHYTGEGVSAVLFANEVDPNRPGVWGADATVEEIIHTINHRGHVSVYPEAFGITPDASRLSNAMDLARGGQFLSVPSRYPDEAWYHYDDTTCDYECMAIEYLYWALVSNMGILDTPETCEGIANEWELCTPSLLESRDTQIHTLIHDPSYPLPMKAPDGSYTPSSTD